MDISPSIRSFMPRCQWASSELKTWRWRSRVPISFRTALPWEAGFLAGRMYREYRRKGGVRRSPLPELFIGAHAVIAGMTLLTRDARRYRTYFPKLKIIAP